MSTLVVNCRFQEFDVYIGRPSLFGNPFSHLASTSAQFRVATREEAVARYREWVKTQPKVLAELPKIRGKRLGCWCSEMKPCHGHVLADLADAL